MNFYLNEIHPILERQISFCQVTRTSTSLKIKEKTFIAYLSLFGSYEYAEEQHMKEKQIKNMLIYCISFMIWQEVCSLDKSNYTT